MTTTLKDKLILLAEEAGLKSSRAIEKLSDSHPILAVLKENYRFASHRDYRESVSASSFQLLEVRHFPGHPLYIAGPRDSLKQIRGNASLGYFADTGGVTVSIPLTVLPHDQGDIRSMYYIARYHGEQLESVMHSEDAHGTSGTRSEIDRLRLVRDGEPIRPVDDVANVLFVGVSAHAHESLWSYGGAVIYNPPPAGV